jgi:hypothetical protein
MKFRRQFLTTLRAQGNSEHVTAVTYGLRSGETRVLKRDPDVDVITLPNSLEHPSNRRVRDFQTPIAALPGHIPVAYWDAGDVLFQSRLEPLWDLVRAHPDELLVVPDALGYPENEIINEWTSQIRNPQARRRAFELMSSNVFLNSGFLAGTARTLHRYLVEAERIIDSGAAGGLGFGTDQVVLNIHCHTNPGTWRAIPEGWNYCLAGRNPRDYRMRHDGYTSSTCGTPVHVVHGNAGGLRGIEWYYRFMPAQQQSAMLRGATGDSAGKQKASPLGFSSFAM